MVNPEDEEAAEPGVYTPTYYDETFNYPLPLRTNQMQQGSSLPTQAMFHGPVECRYLRITATTTRQFFLKIPMQIQILWAQKSRTS